MLLDSNLPHKFWAEAIATACYIRNRCPSSSLNGGIPYTIWYEKPFTVSYFRSFGCKGYSLDKTPDKDKFQPKAKECVLVGYSEESKAYRVWLVNENKIQITRDVKFINELEQIKHEPFEKEEDGRNKEDPLNSIWHKEENNASERITTEPMTDIWEQSDDKGIEEKVTPSNSNGNDANVHEVEVHARGRPRKERSNSRGRPRKIYNKPANPSEEDDLPLGGFEWNFCSNSVDKVCDISNDKMTKDPSLPEWRNAIKEEFISLIKNKTWTICDRPKDQNVVDCRFVLRKKYKPDGQLERRKARLVAKGYAQSLCVDYYETFAPVIRLSTIRMLMAISAKGNLQVHQLDVEAAYLNGELEETVYMEIPEIFPDILSELLESNDPEIRSHSEMMIKQMRGKDKVFHLKKALYGLKQSGRQWYKTLHQTLCILGLKPTDYDPCLYTFKNGNEVSFIGIYVDDLILASSDPKWIGDMKKQLSKEFKMKDLGILNFCLGIEFDCKEEQITLSQKKYILDLLRKFKMLECKPVQTPIEIGRKLTKPEKVSEDILKRYPYRSLIGSLMYLSVATRPDIAYAVNSLSQYNNCYREEHWNAAKRILRYLRGTLNCKLVYKKNGESLAGYVDADWGNCLEDRRSYSGYAFILGDGAISWEAKKQSTVAQSSVEAEYLALAEATKEAMYWRSFLTQIGMLTTTVAIKSDSQGAQKLAQNPTHHSRTKHIDIRHHLVRDAVAEKLISVEYMPTEEMPADVLTKGVPGNKHALCARKLGLVFA